MLGCCGSGSVLWAHGVFPPRNRVGFRRQFFTAHRVLPALKARPLRSAMFLDFPTCGRRTIARASIHMLRETPCQLRVTPSIPKRLRSAPGVGALPGCIAFWFTRLRRGRVGRHSVRGNCAEPPRQTEACSRRMRFCSRISRRAGGWAIAHASIQRLRETPRQLRVTPSIPKRLRSAPGVGPWSGCAGFWFARLRRGRIRRHSARGSCTEPPRQTEACSRRMRCCSRISRSAGGWPIAEASIQRLRETPCQLRGTPSITKRLRSAPGVGALPGCMGFWFTRFRQGRGR